MELHQSPALRVSVGPSLVNRLVYTFFNNLSVLWTPTCTSAGTVVGLGVDPPMFRWDEEDAEKLDAAWVIFSET